MRILNVTNILDQKTGGGTAERTFQMSRYLARAGIECSLLTVNCGLPAARIEALDGVRVTALPCFNRRFQLPRPFQARVNTLVKNADVVHLMNHWTFLNAIVYRAIKKFHKPYVICPAGALPIFGRSPWLKRTYNVLIGRQIVVDADRFIAITPREIPAYLAYGGRQEKVMVIPNGISADDFKFRDDRMFRRKFSLSAHPILLFLGRLNVIKGPDLLLRAFLRLASRYPDFQLVFAGPDGGMLAELEKVIKPSRMRERIKFVGNLAGDDKSMALHAAELLVIPSRQEAMSIVAVEGGFCGTPLLLTDQCGFDVVADIGGGWVVPASEEGLVEGLRQLFEHKDQLAGMGEKMRQYVVLHFLWENIVGKFVSLYEELLAVPGK